MIIRPISLVENIMTSNRTIVSYYIKELIGKYQCKSLNLLLIVA